MWQNCFTPWPLCKRQCSQSFSLFDHLVVSGKYYCSVSLSAPVLLLLRRWASDKINKKKTEKERKRNLERTFSPNCKGFHQSEIRQWDEVYTLWPRNYCVITKSNDPSGRSVCERCGARNPQNWFVAIVFCIFQTHSDWTQPFYSTIYSNYVLLLF